MPDLDVRNIPPLRAEVMSAVVDTATGNPCTVLVCTWCNTIGGHQEECWQRQVDYWKARAKGDLCRADQILNQ